MSLYLQLTAISCTKLKTHSVQGEYHMAKMVFVSLQLLGRTSLCFTDRETQEGNVHSGPTPLQVSSCTKMKMHSVYADCPMAKTFLLFSFFNFLGRAVYGENSLFVFFKFLWTTT